MSFWEPRGAEFTGRFAEVGEAPRGNLMRDKTNNRPLQSGGGFYFDWGRAWFASRLMGPPKPPTWGPSQCRRFSWGGCFHPEAIYGKIITQSDRRTLMDQAMIFNFPTDEFETEMDSVGRFIMPEAFRKELDQIEGLLLMTCYRPGFVVIVPEKTFASSLAKHEKVSVDRWRVSGIAEARREIVRMYFSLSRPAEFDDEWGLVIPSPQREIAHLKKHLVVVGDIDRVEIWDRESRLAEEIDYDS